MSDDRPFPCKSCPRRFKRMGDLNNHYTQNQRCNWVVQQCTAGPPAPIVDYGAPDDYEDDPPPFSAASDDDAMDIDSEHPYFVAATSPTAHAPPRAAPLPLAPQQTASDEQSKRARVEDCLDEDVEIRELFPGAGKTYGRDQTTHEAYLSKAGLANGTYGAFASKLDFDLAQWAKQSKIPDNSLTRLLGIPGVSSYPEYLF